MIAPAYYDVLRLVRDQVKTAGIDLLDQDLYNALVRYESRVYGLEDTRNTMTPMARLRRRTPYIFDSLAAPWVGLPTVSTDTPDPRLEDSAGTTLTPAIQDLQRGIWTFSDAQTIVYITGTYVDIYAAAVECLDLAMERKVEIVTQSGQQGTLNLSDIQGNIARARTRLAGKLRPLPVSSKG